MKNQALLLLSLLLLPALAEAQAQRFIPYRGALERDGRPVNGTVQMQFQLFGAETGGNVLHQELKSVVVTGGSFAAQVGPVPDPVFENPALYLAVAIGGTPLGGRQLVQTSPYAARAQPGAPFRADSLVVGATSQPQATLAVNPAGQTTLSTGLSLGGALTVGGGISLPDGANITTTRLGIVASVPNRNTNNFAAGFLEGTFTDAGGATLVMASASAYCASPGRIQVRLVIDGTIAANMRMYCHVAATHVALPAVFYRLDRLIFPAPPTPTTRTVRLEPINCASGCVTPVVTTFMDSNDFGEIAVIRLPTP